ncbi:MAG: hypothetical protein ACLTB5_13060 [Acutalibacteraceae bacterium]
MKRNIELIRDFIKFVENDMKEKYDYYDKLKTTSTARGVEKI